MPTPQEIARMKAAMAARQGQRQMPQGQAGSPQLGTRRPMQQPTPQMPQRPVAPGAVPQRPVPVGAVPQAVPGTFKKGGKVEKTGMAKVHKGEVVLTKKQAKKVPRSAGGKGMGGGGKCPKGSK